MMMRIFMVLGGLFLVLAAHAEGGLSSRPTSASDVAAALSYDAKTRSWAYATGLANSADATATSARLCVGCGVHGPFGKCGAVASDGAVVGFGEGEDVAAAKAAAQGKCGSTACAAAVWACNSAGGGERTGYGRETRHARNFGAVAFDSRSGAFGAVWDYRSLSEAANAARANCGVTCRIYLAHAARCGALAYGAGASGTGEGVDAAAAERMALAKCGKAECRPIVWFCNSESR